VFDPTTCIADIRWPSRCLCLGIGDEEDAAQRSLRGIDEPRALADELTQLTKWVVPVSALADGEPREC
jgi:hypothetical protein